MILPLLVTALSLSPVLAAKTMIGIRNEKCAESEEAAKLAIDERIATDPKLCEEGFAPKLSGGYSCKSAECKKGTLRCNTQYVCEPKSVDLGPSPAASPIPGASAAPAPVPTKSDSPMPTKSDTPVPTTNVTPVPAPSAAGPAADAKTSPSPKPSAKATATSAPTKETPAPTASAAPSLKDEAVSAAKQAVRLASAMTPVLKAIGTCTPFTGTSPDPLQEGMPNAEMQVHGTVDGKCKFTLTSPKGSYQCAFTDKERADIASGGLTAFRTTMVDPEVCR